MPRERRRKCHHCLQLYRPDPRNRWHQRYCAEAACRAASKVASQGRWRASPEGRDYFRGTANVLRVQLWRKAHPGYWKTCRRKPRALQDHCTGQVLVPPEDKLTLKPRALQDLLATQGLAFTGLVAQLTGSASQENIAATTQRLILLGQQIRGPKERRIGHGGGQTGVVPAAVAAGAAAIQLARPPTGTG